MHPSQRTFLQIHPSKFEKLFEITGVRDLSDMNGKNIRLKTDGSITKEIGHITNESWMNPYGKAEEATEEAAEAVT